MHTIQKTILVLYLFAAIHQGCDSRSQGAETLPSADPECFLFVQERDSVKLSIRLDSTKVFGNLEYRFYEKDQSTGTLEGEMKGDTLFAHYTFTSEGLMSHREVAFLKKGDTFSMGYGEIVNSGNTDVFKNPDSLEFSNRVVLRRAVCD